MALRRLLCIFLLLTLAFLPTAALADASRGAVQFLESQGYSILSVERTWLQRVRIEARKGDLEREMVIDRTTGEVLRDRISNRSEDSNPEEPGFWSELFGLDREGGGESHDNEGYNGRGDTRNDRDDDGDDDGDDGGDDSGGDDGGDDGGDGSDGDGDGGDD